MIAGVRTRQGRAALRLGVAASIEHAGLLRTLNPATVVDVGANRGQFALLCLSVSPSVRVISFEPGARAFDVLKKAIDDERVRLVQAAVASERGHLELNVTADDDSSSLLPVAARQAELFGTRVVRQETVLAAPLSEFVGADELAAPALLKIDVQGAELDVLRGSLSLLERFQWVYVECSFVELYSGQPLAQEIIALLAGRGFALAGVFNQVSTAEIPAVQADLLFARSDARAS